MDAKMRPLVQAIFVLTLVLLSLVSGPNSVGASSSGEIGAYVDGPHRSISTVSARSDAPTCVTVQRGVFGQVADSFIWSACPQSNYNYYNLYTGFVGSGEKRSLIHFGLDFLPQSVVIQSAVFGIHRQSKGSGDMVYIYRVTEPWSEGEPTWNSFADSYDDTVVWSSFVADGPGSLTVDVTDLVAAWAGGAVDNHGLMLRNSGTVPDVYTSSEIGDVSLRPWLQVCYVENGDPVAVNDAVATDEGMAVDVDVLANDADPDDDVLTVSSVTQPGHGSVVNNVTYVTYTPDPGFCGDDAFTYTVLDEHGGTATATVNLTVICANEPPVAADDEATTGPGMPVEIDVLFNDTDTDGTPDPATVTIVDDPAHGSASVDPINGAVVYSPDAGYTGVDSFTYTVDDDDGATSNVATVTVTVEDTSDDSPPVAVDDQFSTYVDTPVDVDVLANDFDPDGDALTVSDHDVASVEGGVVSCAGGGVCTYSPPAGFMGTDSFDYVASDGRGGTDGATVTVQISESGPASLSNFVYLPLILNASAASLNAAPVAMDDWATTEEDTPVDVNVLANDTDPDGDILVLSDHDVASAEGGVVSCTVLGVCTYSPPAGFIGTGTFDYTAGDGSGGTDGATVTVEVVESGSAPAYKLYVPLIYNSLLSTASMPDLVVTRLVATSNSVNIAIKNESDEPFYPFDVYIFRVDFYVAPDPVPTGVNQAWNDGRSAQGAVWYVPAMALATEAGGEVTLTVGDGYYRPSLSNLPDSLPVGTPVYAQIDSANPGTTHGVVLESHEVAREDYNNITGPVLSTP